MQSFFKKIDSNNCGTVIRQRGGAGLFVNAQDHAGGNTSAAWAPQTHIRSKVAVHTPHASTHRPEDYSSHRNSKYDH